jgi:hypothetical protein
MTFKRFPTLFAGIAATFALAGPALAEDPHGACHIGAYRLDDGRFVDVGPSAKALRWRTLDGRTGKLTQAADGAWTSQLGWTDHPDGIAFKFGDCGQDQISFEGHPGRRIAFDVQDSKFKGDGLMLAGRLVLPPGKGPFPIVVLVHGSESTSAIEQNSQQRMLPAQGLGVFVYDKRGSGGSEGKYTQDFRVLARDAAAAVAEARRLAGGKAGRVGLDGGSQGGWIAPLAASQAPVDFVIVRFGLAESALGEDRSQVFDELTRNGYGPDVLAKARKLTDATDKVIASGFKDGWAEIAEAKRLYGEDVWFKGVEGEFTGQIAHNTEAEVKAVGPTLDQGTSWDYEPVPVLQALKAPQLWILGGADREAPNLETRKQLLGLVKQGRPITVLSFPDTDHGILQFETDAQGKRTSTRYADGYWAAEADFARSGRLEGAYGKAEWLTRRPKP